MKMKFGLSLTAAVSLLIAGDPSMFPSRIHPFYFNECVMPQDKLRWRLGSGIPDIDQSGKAAL
jgi:hypothetical protein